VSLYAASLGADMDDGGAPGGASATLSFSMGMTIPCDGRTRYLLDQGEGCDGG